MKNINSTKKYEGRIRQSVVLLLPALVITGGGVFLFIILLLKNSRRELLAFGPIFIFLIILGILEVLDFLIFRIWFDEEKIMVRNLFGFRKIYYWSQIIGISRQIFCIEIVFENGKICLDDTVRNREMLIWYVKRMYPIYHGGEEIHRLYSSDRRGFALEEFLIIAGAIVICCYMFVVMGLMPSSNLTVNQFEGKILSNYVRCVENQEIMEFFMPGIVEKFQIPEGSETINDYQAFINDVHSGTEFILSAEMKMKNKKAYYQVFQIEKKDGKKYLTYRESNRQEWQEHFIEKILCIGVVIFLSVLFFLALLAYLNPQKFSFLRHVFFRC